MNKRRKRERRHESFLDRAPAVAVFSQDMLHRTYTWSARQTKVVDIVFSKNGACVMWAAAASKVINESLLTGSDGCRWCGGCGGGAAAAVATRRRLRSMCDAVTRRCVAAALLTCKRLRVRKWCTTPVGAFDMLPMLS